MGQTRRLRKSIRYAIDLDWFCVASLLIWVTGYQRSALAGQMESEAFSEDLWVNLLKIDEFNL
jgi:hypothetical protein